jgi:hypothetical protein
MKTITKTIATRYAMTVGLAGALALTAVSHSFAQIRTGAEAGTTVSQYCAPPGRGEARRAQVLLPQRGMIEQRSIQSDGLLRAPGRETYGIICCCPSFVSLNPCADN